MRLRTKILLIGCGTLVLVLACGALGFRAVVLREFARVEREYTARNLQRVMHAIDQTVQHYDRVTYDWAAWDDTCAFIVNSNRSYIQHNLVDQTFEGSAINLMVFVNPSGTIMYAKAYDLAQKRAVAVPRELAGHLGPQTRLVAHSNEEGRVGGLLCLDRRPMLVVSRPIITSENKGPIRGALIVGRWLDEAELARLRKVTQLQMAMHCRHTTNVMNAFARATIVGRDTNVRVDAGTGATGHDVYGYVQLCNIYGQPCTITAVPMPRTVYARGRATVRAAMLMLGLTGVCFIVLASVTLERFVLRRVARLHDDVTRISTTGDSAARVAADGTDELAHLGTAVNAMLTRIEHGRQDTLASEDRYAKLVESSPDGVCVATAQTIVFANPSMARILGARTPADVVGKSWAALLPPAAAQAWQQHYEQLRDSARSDVPLSLRVRQADGAEMAVDIVSVPITYQGTWAVQSVVRDVTAQRRAEAGQLREVAQSARCHAVLLALMKEPATDFAAALARLLETVAQTLPVARVSYWAYTAERTAIACCDCYCAQRHEHRHGNLLHAGDYPRYFAALEELKNIVAHDIDTDARVAELKDGYLRPLGITAMLDTAVRSHGATQGILCLEHIGPARLWTHADEEFAGSVADLIALAHEADQRQRAEAALRVSESRLALAQQCARLGTWDWDLATNVVVWSPTTLQLFGIESATGIVTHATFMEHVHPLDRARVDAAVQACLTRGVPYVIEHRILRANGAQCWVAELGDVLPGADGTPARMLGVTADITARKAAEDMAAAERECLAVTLRSIGDGVISTDTTGAITLMNRVAEELTGWLAEEACGRLVDEVFRTLAEDTRAACASPVNEVLQQRAIVQLDEARILVMRDGTERVVRDSAAPICDSTSAVIGVVLVFRDVSVERRMEGELLKAQKIESISVLAGGIAHDFNNLLTIVLGNVSLARMHAENSPLVNERLNDAETAVAQAMQLTQQLLTFARGNVPMKQCVALGQLVRDTVPLMLRGSAVRYELRTPEDAWAAEIDPGQIAQVLNNLVLNAVQAMPHGGQLQVAVENVLLATALAPHMQPGAHVRITVHDTGPGIAPEHLQNIFDPYFTTKSKGNGLGLTISYSIIKNHKGVLTVESPAGQGTSFFIYLPAVAAAHDARPSAPPALLPGKGHVLLMDDELIILRTTRAVLEKLGYHVATSEHGAAAVQAYQEAHAQQNPFDVVIVDMTVPGGMGGADTLRALLAIDPAVRCIATSGYFSNDVASNLSSLGFKALLRKPYTIAQLQATLRTVLAS